MTIMIILVMSDKEFLIQYKENGPYLVIIDGKVRAALCRCGGSDNKPYCDGTHTKKRFMAEAGELRF
jgi:CDGSH-type Zn-finger protein